jgi:hypothetical protein
MTAAREGILNSDAYKDQVYMKWAKGPHEKTSGSGEDWDNPVPSYLGRGTSTQLWDDWCTNAPSYYSEELSSGFMWIL